MATTMESWVEKSILGHSRDYNGSKKEKIKGFIEDLFHGGMASGIVGELIYYTDTTKFYDKFENEIWDIAYEMSKDMGSKNVLEFIASLNGAGDVGGGDQFKNLLCWFAYEETARIIAGKYGIEI